MNCRHTLLILAFAIFAVSNLSTLTARASRVDVFAEVASTSWTERLFEHINQRWDDSVKHQLVVRADGTHVSIGSITLDDPKFMRLLGRAVGRGEVAEVEAGRVIGPKALNFLVHIESIAPKERAMKITGSISPQAVLRAKELQLAQTKKFANGQAMDPASKWTDAEVQKFDAAFEKLKLEEACKNLWKQRDLRLCKSMKFEFTAGDIEHISWSLAK